MELSVKLEGLLFYRSAPVKKTELQTVFSVTESELETALADLTLRLEAGATRLLVTEKEVQLVVAPELDDLIESLRLGELNRDIGRAGAETLAIVLYREPISRAEIDLIRGVNSTFILRNLLMRGLVNRETCPGDSRSYRYSITPALLSHLGITKKTDLPDWEGTMTKLDTYLTEAADKPASDSDTLKTDENTL